MVPAGAVAGNQETAEQTAATLQQSGQLRHYHIAVLHQDGTTWLKGQVATQDQMDIALQLAFGSPGVRRVVNHLVVSTDDTPRVAVQPTDSPSAEVSQNKTKGGVSMQEPPRRTRFKEPRPQTVPGLVGQTVPNSRLPWAPDIVVNGPLTPMSADPDPGLQTHLIAPPMTPEAPVGAVWDGQPLQRSVRRELPAAATGRELR